MYKQGLSIDEALAQSQQRLSEYLKNIADEAYPTLIAEIDRLKEENARLKEENARFKEAIAAVLISHIATETLKGGE
jgi:FtsZ-binding cell division protein ZapB